MPERQIDAQERLTLVDYLDRGRYASVFRDRFLYPMAAAIWSMSPDAIREFPATTLVRFFANHQFLQINNQPKWRTCAGEVQRTSPS